jgi:radical SAM superfamily enzyme
MTGDMDVARLTVLTHGFCHFCPVKSEATPTQQKFKPLHKYADVIKHQTAKAKFYLSK